MSAFRIGLLLVTAGAVWIGVLFSGADRATGSEILRPSASAEVTASLAGPSLGYFTIHMPEYSGEEVFAQIVDSAGNVIQEDLVKTRLSVGYFDYAESGQYTVRVANISDRIVLAEVEIGGAGSRDMIPGGALLIAGVLVMMVMGYLRMKNHSMAQPDENIS